MVDLRLYGVPQSTSSTIRGRLAEMAKPEGRITQLQNRLDGLDRLQTAIARAGETIGQPFPQHDQLLAARGRAAEIAAAIEQHAASQDQQDHAGEAAGAASPTPDVAESNGHRGPAPAALRDAAYPRGIGTELRQPAAASELSRPPSRDTRVRRLDPSAVVATTGGNLASHHPDNPHGAPSS